MIYFLSSSLASFGYTGLVILGNNSVLTRSYERQEIDKLPSVHLGPYASNLEKNGEKTELGNFNRAIEKHNKEKMTLLELIGKIKSVISEIADKLRRLRTNSVKEPTLTEILLD